MPDVRCISKDGHPATLLDGASRPWGHGDVRQVPGMTAQALVSRHPSRFQVLDRALRGTVPQASAPEDALNGHHRAVVAAVKRGDYDAILGPLREDEATGADRPSVLAAIDARAREVAAGVG